MSEDRAAVTMVDLALRAVTLRLRELEADLWQMSPTWRDRVIPQIQQLRERQWELEVRLNRRQIEAQDTAAETKAGASGAEELYPAVEDALFFVLPNLVSVERS